jgi:hypothetical protein
MGAAAIVWQRAPSVFAVDVAQHEERGRHAVQLLADPFADALHGLAAGAVGLGDLVAMLHTRQAGAEAPALESRDLKVQGLVPGLLEFEFALEALQPGAQV